MRPAFTLLMLLSALALAACTAPAPNDQTPTASTAQTPAQPAPVAANQTPPARSEPAPPSSAPLPPQRQPEPAAGAGATPIKLDTSCKTDADCTVKNVGNCCGEFPSCVNVNSPTDPQAVQAACAKSGMMSVCGFQPVDDCECVQGQCRDLVMQVQ